MKDKHVSKGQENVPPDVSVAPVKPINPTQAVKKNKGSHARASQGGKTQVMPKVGATTAFNGPYDGAYGGEGSAAYPSQTVAFDQVASTAAFGFGEEQQAAKPHDSKNAAKKPGRKKPALIALGTLAGVLLAVYLVGFFIFSSHFYPNTTMGAFDISLMSKSDAVSVVEKASKDYELSVSGQGLEFVISGADSGMNLDPDAVVDAALEMNDAFLWPVKVFGEHDLGKALVVESDKEALDKFLKDVVGAFNKDSEPSKDAKVAYSKKAGKFIVKDEVYGTQVSEEAVREEVAAAIAAMDTKLELTEKVLTKPSVVSTDKRLAAGAEAANKLITCDVTLVDEVSGVVITEVNADDASQWIKFDKDFNPSVKKKALNEWANDLASSLSTVGAERTYTRPDGKKITVSGGDYGWEADASSLASLVIDAVEQGKTGEIAVPCASTGNGYTDAGQDWGAYCDIDLTEQRARYYNANGELLWQSPVVTGNPNNGDDTPTGVYYLKNLERNISLKGPIDPETNEPEWDSPVSYWMPFVGNLIGLHDASWQPSSVFGDPDAYKTYGSKGCVNLPTNKAKALYNTIQIGDVVVVHW